MPVKPSVSILVSADSGPNGLRDLLKSIEVLTRLHKVHVVVCNNALKSDFSAAWKIIQKHNWSYFLSQRKLSAPAYREWCHQKWAEHATTHNFFLRSGFSLPQHFFACALKTWGKLLPDNLGALNLVGETQANEVVPQPVVIFEEGGDLNACYMVSEQYLREWPRIKDFATYRVAKSLIDRTIPAPRKKSKPKPRAKTTTATPKQAPPRIKKAAFFVATTHRPMLLEACLTTLQKQRVPEGWDYEILVGGEPTDEGKAVVLKAERARYVDVANHTVTSKLNGILQAAGPVDLVLLADDDDIQPLGRLEAAAKAHDEGAHWSGVSDVLFYAVQPDRVMKWSGRAEQGLVGTSISFSGELLRKVGGWPERARGKDGPMAAAFRKGMNTRPVFKDITKEMDLIVCLQHGQNIWNREVLEKGGRSRKGSFEILGMGSMAETEGVSENIKDILLDIRRALPPLSPAQTAPPARKPRIVSQRKPRHRPPSRNAAPTQPAPPPSSSFPPLNPPLKVVLATIVLNEDEFIEMQLKQHLDWPGLVQWVFVEGATLVYGERNPDAVNDKGLSVDNTSKLLQEAAKNPLVTYVPFGWADGPMGQQKIALRNAYCEVADKYDADILIAIDADEFYTKADQQRILDVVVANPNNHAWLFQQRHLWRPPSIGDKDPTELEVTGGYWKIPHTRVWRWEKGARYKDNHNHIVLPGRSSGARPYRWRTNDPECIHLGFARRAEHRKRTNAYYVARGEGKEKGKTNRGWYVDCRSAWDFWKPGDDLPHRAQVIKYNGAIPEILQKTTTRPKKSSSPSPSKKDIPRVGLTGFCVPTGLGYEHHRMWKKLPLEKWLIHHHKKLGVDEGMLKGLRTEGISRQSNTRDIGKFLEGLDVVVAVERTMNANLFARAKEKGIRTVLLCNAEWFVESKPWFQDADLIIARTQQGVEVLTQGGIEASRIAFALCPIDVDEFPFEQRHVARNIIFSNGWGGVHQRKGWPQIRTALVQKPGLLTVRSQHPIRDVPRHVTSLGSAASPREMYKGFDVACQPSHWEGVGLSILEAMACGIPVITTNGPPMRDYIKEAHPNDHQSLLVDVEREQEVKIWGPWTAYVPSEKDLFDKLVRVKDTNISRLSREARTYIEDVHGKSGWDKLWKLICG